MKICFVLEYYSPHIGGAETFFKNLAEGLVKSGHQSFVVTARLSGTSEYEIINGVEVYRINLPRLLPRYWFTFFAIPAIYKVAKSCDIIHTRTYNGAFPAFLVSKLTGKPVVITVFELLLGLWKTLSGMNWFNARLHALIERVTVGLPFDKYICISYYTRNYLRLCGIGDKKIEMVYPGVDYDRFSNQRRDGDSIRDKFGLNNNFVYLYFGRPGFFKGVEFLVRAVPLISEKIAGAKLLLILSKEPRGRYKHILSIIRDLKLEDSLILLENVGEDELIKYISCCDCAVSPSLTEGFGFTCVEACSMGRPVVATDVGAIPEVIFGKYVLVSPQSPEDICRGIESVYIGETSFKSKKAFNWQECVWKYERVYEELLDRR